MPVCVSAPQGALSYNERMKKLAIIGGGAAGLAAAIAAGEALRTRGVQADIVVFEADDRVGRSILATGNGRCNFSNAQVDAEVYRQTSFVGIALDALSRQAGEFPQMGDPVHRFFASLGLVWREESEGRLYPLANKASSVLDVLRAAMRAVGVREVCESTAVRIDVPTSEDERFRVRLADGAVECAEAVIVAVGGRVAKALLPRNLPFFETRPVLGPLCTNTSTIKSLNNVRVRCAVSLVDVAGSCKVREQGEILFRDYGVSGIAVFNVSRFAERGDKLLIDLIPQVPENEAEAFLQARYDCLLSGRAMSAVSFLDGILLPPVSRVVLKAAGVRPEAPLSVHDIPRLACALKAFMLEVQGLGDARQCQVHRGGVSVAAVDAPTLEIHKVPGLYVVGEALDVDAPCGGYNLHWAWASGLLAGRHAIERMSN